MLKEAFRSARYNAAVNVSLDQAYSDRPVIRPNSLGIAILAVGYMLSDLYWRFRQSRCKHPNLVDDSFGGPDSGCMAGHCPDCGWDFHHRLY